MKQCCKMVMLAISIFAQTVVVADHTQAETNRVVRACLDRVRFYASLDDFDRDRELRRRTCPNTWEKFLGEDGDGWSFAERKAAFDWYLSTLGTTDFRERSRKEKSYVLYALSQCDRLRYTNAVSSIMALALNTNGVERDVAVEVALKICPVGDAATEFVDCLTTNPVVRATLERGSGLCEYGMKITACSETNTPAHARAVAMFFRNRASEVAASIGCDVVLTNFLSGYSLSSNRLAVAQWALQDTELVVGRYRDYFISVTNQLLSSGQPLRQLTIGEAGE